MCFGRANWGIFKPLLGYFFQIDYLCRSVHACLFQCYPDGETSWFLYPYNPHPLLVAWLDSQPTLWKHSHNSKAITCSQGVEGDREGGRRGSVYPHTFPYNSFST